MERVLNSPNEKFVETMQYIKKIFDPRELQNLHKFLISIVYGDQENFKTTEEYGVKLTKCRHLKVLTIDNKELKRILELAKQMGFIEAYIEKPQRLATSDVTEVIRRMSKFDADGKPYKNENGKHDDCLFSALEYKDSGNLTDFAQSIKEKINEKEEKELNINIIDCVQKFCEYSNITDQAEIEAMCNKAQEGLDQGKDIKESLNIAFSKWGDPTAIENYIDDFLGKSSSRG